MAVDRRAGHHLLGGRLRAVLGTLQDRLALVAWMKRLENAGVDEMAAESRGTNGSFTIKNAALWDDIENNIMG